MQQPFARRLTHPFLFGVATSNFCDRADFMDAVNRFLTATQYAANSHVYPQNCRKIWNLHNPAMTPMHVQIIKCTYKCSGGQASGPYVSPTTTTMAAPNPFALNEITGVMFDQRMRDPNSGVGTIVASNTDQILATNTAAAGVVIVPTVGYGSVWEQYDTAGGTLQSLDAPSCKQKLSWIFPRIHQKVKCKTVFSRWMKPMEETSFSETESWPKVLTPQQLEDQSTPTYYGKQTHFYIMRVYSTANRVIPTGSGTASTATSTRRWNPAMIRIKLTRIIGCRQSGDHAPGYTCGNFTATPSLYAPSSTFALTEQPPASHMVATNCVLHFPAENGWSVNAWNYPSYSNSGMA